MPLKRQTLYNDYIIRLSYKSDLRMERQGHGPRRSMRWPRKLGTRNSWQRSVFCEESFGKYRALFVHLAFKDVYLFPKGSTFELSWKPAR